MKKLTVLLSGLAIFGSSMAFASTTTTTNTNAQKPPHKEPSAEVKKAMDECRASLGIAKKVTTNTGTNTGTKPAKPTAEQRQKMDGCMTKKGFKKPEGGPHKHHKKPEGQATSSTSTTKKTS